MVATLTLPETALTQAEAFLAVSKRHPIRAAQVVRETDFTDTPRQLRLMAYCECDVCRSVRRTL